MAEKTSDEATTNRKEPVQAAEAATEKQAAPAVEASKPSTQKKGHPFPQLPVWGWVVGAVAVFFALFGFVAASSAVFHGLKKDTKEITARAGSDYSLREDQLGGRSTKGTDGGMMGGPGGGFGMMDGTTNSSSRVSGVVTAVDGDTLTVAGNGTTVTVKVTNDTTYNGASKPAAVNDTIMASGSKSDGVFTATSIRLVRV